MLGAEFYRSEGCNVIVAVGGGSPMDCAKGIGIVAAHGRSILEFEGALPAAGAESAADPDPDHRRDFGGRLAVRDHFQPGRAHEVLRGEQGGWWPTSR